MYTECIFYLWRVRNGEKDFSSPFFFLPCAIFFHSPSTIQRPHTPPSSSSTQHHEGFFFCNDGILRKASSSWLSRVCVGGKLKAGWTSPAHRFFFAFFGPSTYSQFMCLISRCWWEWGGDVYMPFVYIFAWRQKYVNHLMISTHCLRRRMCVWEKGAKKGAEKWMRDTFYSCWPFNRLFCRIKET